MKLTISCLLNLQILYTKFGKDWPSSSLGEDVNARHTTDDDGRQPIAISHLCDSVDLKRYVCPPTLAMMFQVVHLSIFLKITTLNFVRCLK